MWRSELKGREPAVSAPKSYAEFSNLSAAHKQQFWRAEALQPSLTSIRDVTKRLSLNRVSKVTEKAVRNIIGKEAYAELLETVSAAARRSAEALGNPGIKVGAAQLGSHCVCEANGEVWGHEVMIAAYWSDRYNTDKIEALTARFDRDGKEFWRG